MSRKDQIVAELDALSEDDLDRVLQAIREMTRAEPREKSLMAQLRTIQIDGPADLSVNHDAYASGFDPEP